MCDCSCKCERNMRAISSQQIFVLVDRAESAIYNTGSGHRLATKLSIENAIRQALQIVDAQLAPV